MPSALQILNTILIATVLWVVFYLYMKFSHNYWKRRGVPSPPEHWFFGNLKDGILFRRNPSVAIGDVCLQAPPEDGLVGIYILHKPFLLIKDPDLIKRVLVKDFHAFADRFFISQARGDKIGSANLFSVKNPEWRHLRTNITPVFTSGKIKRLFELIVATTVSMSDFLHKECPPGSKMKSILMRNATLRYTTDIVSSVAFGIHINSFDPNNDEFFRKAQQGLKQTALRNILFASIFFFPAFSKYTNLAFLGDATSYFRGVFWDSFNNRETSKAKRGDLIDSLIELKANKQDNNFKMEGDVLVSQAAIFFVAGRESSVTTICFSLYELAKQPDLQKRVREEILETIQNHGITYESVQGMTYLHQVISETLRLYPPAPIIDRVATVDYRIPDTDIVIEKGTPIYVPLCGLQRDPKYFPDPDRYDPDRFSSENKSKIKPFTYMPFGEGPRNCIGMRLGTLMSSMGLITILKDFEVTIDPTYKYEVDRQNPFLAVPEDFRMYLTKL